jgi:acyl carrier protein
MPSYDAASNICLALLVGADVLPDEPLMDAGLDSLTAVEARSDLSNAFGVPLSATVLFDYPTAAALAGHIFSLLAPPPPRSSLMASSSGVGLTASVVRGSGRLAVVTACASASGGVSGGGGSGGRERTAPIPPSRWDADGARVVSGASAAPYLPASFGAFLSTPEQFDPGYFAISAVEAAAVDVQQRLVLDATVGRHRLKVSENRC